MILPSLQSTFTKLKFAHRISKRSLAVIFDPAVTDRECFRTLYLENVNGVIHDQAIADAVENMKAQESGSQV